MSVYQTPEGDIKIPSYITWCLAKGKSLNIELRKCDLYRGLVAQRLEAPSMSLWRSLVQFPVKPSIFRFSSLFNSCSDLFQYNQLISLLARDRPCMCEIPLYNRCYGGRVSVYQTPEGDIKIPSYITYGVYVRARA